MQKGPARASLGQRVDPVGRHASDQDPAHALLLMERKQERFIQACEVCRAIAICCHCSKSDLSVHGLCDVQWTALILRSVCFDQAGMYMLLADLIMVHA